ncbi:NAD(P)H-quinone oxidoreductase [Kytococcus sedentarius]|uniref:NAD(P)H quinone oxidoreductase, PIG3 family n=1 Tax=Kytococcus sedentarius (strain ATCC 14392 / DSM 20547 / JCM 11482 / CCUG 33030 / NBRC 15357 / NCTC 11040 / CCM 314 / 541) TaxID=478801 RepID=C7NKK1_KYTSD|nr:NAD(P)H-quinone oxidoreductase [Kytococcus sedentarius]ACV05487.1 putative NAD(P)H quinone oxidoreductase, PIG3 family [Kytococcus sedentarius DSM 20547]QQB63926.1 NAD(P)H-quinone oxidoreductase [Kytococcus sedentarius]STX13100.1 Quinone oxidoreductase 1 [Kytococcus sedentarius]
MRAIVIDNSGEKPVLTLSEVEDPTPGEGEVLVEVAAAGVNRADLVQASGKYPPPPGESELIGLEVSGRIAALGAGDTGDWQVGDEVCALLAGGGYAEKVAVSAGQLLPVPAGVDLQTAASLPEVACTVWSNLVDAGHLAAGETVLLHGGSSGIGTMGIQVAKALGARVIVTAGSQEKLQRCAELGADVLVNYQETDFLEAVGENTEDGVDVILDLIGADYLDRNLQALAKDGRLVIIGLMGGREGEINLGLMLQRRLSVQATALRGRDRADKARIVAAVRENVWPRVESGEIRPVVQEVLPWEKAQEAHQLLKESQHVGKVVLRVG